MNFLLKRLLRNSPGAVLSSIGKANNLRFDYSINKAQIPVLKEIFIDRTYSAFFPFYQQAIIVDIGAHYGYFSLFAARNVAPASVIYAIEPDAENYYALCSNISLNNFSNILPFQCAIGGTDETARLFKGSSPNNSLVKDYALINAGCYSEVRVKSLEQFIRENNIHKIDFLKMDCEGSEYAIIENTPPEIFSVINTVSMEFHDLKHEKYNGQFIVNTLRKNNFSIVRYDYSKTSMGLNYGRIIALKQ